MPVEALLRPSRTGARLLAACAVLLVALVGFAPAAYADHVKKLTGYGCKLTNYTPKVVPGGKIVFHERIKCNSIINGMDLSLGVGWKRHETGQIPRKHTYHKRCLNVSLCSIDEQVKKPSGPYWYVQAVEDYYTNPKAGINASVVDRIDVHIK